MIILSQQDEHWSSKKLGFSTDTTIGSDGCLITCLSMIWDSDPIKVNNWLKNNNGYANLNLVVWTSLPGFEWRGWIYEDDKVKDALKKHGSCIIETDFNANPKDGSHFIVAIGNGKIYDPWDGKKKAFSSYKSFYGYAVINPLKNPLREATMASTPDWIIENSDKWIGTLTYLEITTNNPTLDNVKDVVGGIKARAIDMEKQKGQLEAKATALGETISNLNGRLTTQENTEKELNTKLNDTQRLLTESQGQVTGMINDKQKLAENLAECLAKRSYNEKLRIRKWFVGKYK